MSKVNGAIFVAGLFITGVLLFLMWDGVRLKERRMVKWSGVHSSDEAGQKIGRFFFPIIQEYGQLIIVGKDEFSQKFSQSFKDVALKNSPQAQVLLLSKPDEESQGKFIIYTQPVVENFKELCQQGDKLACVGLSAQYKFNKKKRDPQRIWITMYRISENETVLYYQSPSKNL